MHYSTGKPDSKGYREHASIYTGAENQMGGNHILGYREEVPYKGAQRYLE